MSEITITLTIKQGLKLESFLNMHKQERLDNQKKWEERSKETNFDGTPKYTDLERVIQWWQETNVALDEVTEMLNDAIYGKEASA